MNVESDYLEQFALPAILKQPKEITLNDWEMFGGPSVGLDDPEGKSLSIFYWDEWPQTQQWKIKKGTDKRWTLVRVTQVDAKTGAEIVDPVGYEFEGLYTPAMLREWFRHHLGVVKADAAEENDEKKSTATSRSSDTALG